MRAEFDPGHAHRFDPRNGRVTGRRFPLFFQRPVGDRRTGRDTTTQGGVKRLGALSQPAHDAGRLDRGPDIGTVKGPVKRPLRDLPYKPILALAHLSGTMERPRATHRVSERCGALSHGAEVGGSDNGTVDAVAQFSPVAAASERDPPVNRIIPADAQWSGRIEDGTDTCNGALSP